jgi:hypothetical protein
MDSVFCGHFRRRQNRGQSGSCCFSLSNLNVLCFSLSNLNVSLYVFSDLFESGRSYTPDQYRHNAFTGQGALTVGCACAGEYGIFFSQFGHFPAFKRLCRNEAGEL